MGFRQSHKWLISNATPKAPGPRYVDLDGYLAGTVLDDEPIDPNEVGGRYLTCLGEVIELVPGLRVTFNPGFGYSPAGY